MARTKAAETPNGKPTPTRHETLNTLVALAGFVVMVVIAVRDGGGLLLVFITLGLIGAVVAATGWMRGMPGVVVTGLVITGVALIITATLGVILNDDPDLQDVQLSAGCNESELSAEPDDLLDLSYDITVVGGTMEVDLGLAFYDEAGNDRASGMGDGHAVRIEEGTRSFDRQFRIPNVTPGDYELVVEVWPTGALPDPEGVETLADDQCDNFVVVQQPEASSTTPSANSTFAIIIDDPEDGASFEALCDEECTTESSGLLRHPFDQAVHAYLLVAYDEPDPTYYVQYGSTVTDAGGWRALAYLGEGQSDGWFFFKAVLVDKEIIGDREGEAMTWDSVLDRGEVEVLAKSDTVRSQMRAPTSLQRP